MMEKRSDLMVKFLGWHAAKVGVYATGVYLVLFVLGRAPVPKIARVLNISRSQVLRALRSLEEYGVIYIERMAGHGNVQGINNSIDWRVCPIDSKIDFPEALTCEWGHDWGENDSRPVCGHCGLLRSEEEYKLMNFGGMKEFARRRDG